MSLPILQTKSNDVSMLQTRWSAIINPVIDAPANKSILLKEVVLAVGSNTINHLLGRRLQGWSIVRKRSPAAVYDNQDNNQQQALTLILVSDAAVTVDLMVF